MMALAAAASAAVGVVDDVDVDDGDDDDEDDDQVTAFVSQDLQVSEHVALGLWIHCANVRR